MSSEEMIIPAIIQTAGGNFWDYENLNDNTFKIEEIACALSMICRFNGHCNRFYSVAEHSVLVSHAVPYEHALAGLLHDAAEAYVGDMSSPLKQMFPSFQKLEKDIQSRIYSAFGIDGTPAEVKEADIRILITEWHQLFSPTDRDREIWGWASEVEPLPVEITCMPWWVARQAFIERFRELCN